jgi:hypothetical protein
MNEINAAAHMRVAATEKGEAERIIKVKQAEGDAQSKALQGRGIADLHDCCLSCCLSTIGLARNAGWHSVGGEILSDQSIIKSLAGFGAVWTQVMINPAQSDDRLS